ncbi:MAG: hypothetical protein ACRD3V_19465 [Vicinamibacteria bacterium]
MRKFFFILSGSAVLGGLLACDDRFRWDAFSDLNDPREEAGAEAALAKAREARANVYAPALYGAAVEALERGATGDGTGTLEEKENAEAVAMRAMDEAIRAREEAKQAAHVSIRDASVLVSVVESILSNEPPNPEALPSDARLLELRSELSRALKTYEAGDYAIAGHIAQAVYSKLASS